MLPRLLALVALAVGSGLCGGCQNSDEEPARSVETFNSADPADVARQKVLPSGTVGVPGAGAAKPKSPSAAKPKSAPAGGK